MSLPKQPSTKNMRTGALSDESVRRFCRTIERDRSSSFAYNPLAHRSGRRIFRQELAREFAGPTMNVTIDVERQLFRQALHFLQGVEGEEEEEEGEEEEGEADPVVMRTPPPLVRQNTDPGSSRGRTMS